MKLMHTDEALCEIIRRSRKIVIKRNYHAVEILAASSCGLLIALLTTINCIPRMAMTTTDNSVYGSLLLGVEKGGYVLVALVAFVLGVMVALLCIKCRRLRDCKREEEE